MKIGIIGVGFVGGATAQVLKEKHEVVLYDKYREGMKDETKLKGSEILLLCLPTPMKASGEMEFSALHDSLNLLETLYKDTPKNERPLLILRSTAVSGTTDTLAKKYDFHFGFNPEFLRERSAVEDMKNTDRIVLGANRQEDHDKAKKMYQELFPNATYILVNNKTAEMIKYAANVMLLGQISIANELYQICNTIGVNYDTIKEAILLDDRIGTNIQVPGPDGDVGFGGKCFPKDLNALIYLAREQQYRPYLLEELWRTNEKLRNNKDWLKIPGATTKIGFEQRTRSGNIPISGVPNKKEETEEEEEK